MAKLFDLVKVNTSTTGTGDITFGAPFSPGFFTPTEVGASDGDTVRYVVFDGDNVEIGLGLIKSGVTQMERTVLRSRIGGVAGASKINLSGTAFVAFTAAASDILNPADNLAGLANAATARANIGADVLTGLRNKIIDGDFNFWSAGTSFSISGYTADMWKLSVGSGASCLVTRGAVALGTVIGHSSPASCLLWARSVAGTAASKISQPIEYVRTFQDQTATITFWASADTATTLDVLFRQNFGTGGSPSSSVDTAAQTVSIGTALTKFSLLFNVGSIAGKTIGSDVNDYLELIFQRNHNDTNPTATIKIAHVSAVLGDATKEDDPSPSIDVGSELARCQRYYERMRPCDVNFCSTETNSVFTVELDFKREKRAVPTTKGDISNAVSSGVNKTINIDHANRTNARILYTAQSAAPNNYITFSSSDYYEFDARL